MRPQALLLAGALLAPVHAARLDPNPSGYNAVNAAPNSRLFPFLTWLRDGAIELVFGAAPAKAAARPTASFQSRYKDRIVMRFNLTTLEEEAAFADVVAHPFFDVWAINRDFVDVQTRKKNIRLLLRLLPKSLHYTHTTLISDLGASVYENYPTTAPAVQIRRLEDGRASLQMSHDRDENVFFQDYQPLSVILPWMRLMEAMFPSITELISIGKSYEGRDIPALQVGVKTPGKLGGKRKTVVVTGGMHAREWISTTTTNYLAWSFIKSFGKEPMITKLLEHFDFIFIPAVNPDGVEYTWEVDRLWRKSRQPTSMEYCRGFDLDHAFGFEWTASSLRGDFDPCSESYGGHEPWEATEALALARWAKNASEKRDFVGLIDLHSYSQQVLFPFAYSCDTEPPNVENLEELAAGLAKAIRLSNGELYSVTSACDGAVTVLGENSTRRFEMGGGSAIDWFYHEMHAHYSYQIKLRDTGSYGFLLPKDHIVPVGEEIFSAMKYFGDYLLGNNGIEKSTGAAEDDSDRGVELKRRRR